MHGKCFRSPREDERPQGEMQSLFYYYMFYIMSIITTIFEEKKRNFEKTLGKTRILLKNPGFIGVFFQNFVIFANPAPGTCFFNFAELHVLYMRIIELK